MHRFLIGPAVAIWAVATWAMAGPAAAQVRNGGDDFGHMWGDGHMWGGGYGMGYGVFGGFVMVLFWVAVIAFVVVALRWGMDRGPGKRTSTSALEILQTRLAKGEVDPKEYEERKKALEG